MVASSTNPIIFYDLKSKHLPYKSWSSNTLKTRLLLNHKGLPYKTTWLSYPGIAPTLTARGFKSPHPSGKFTLPAIEDPSSDGSSPPTCVSESYMIARYLDEKYPDTPAVLPRGTEALQELFIHHYEAKCLTPSRPLVVPLVPALLDEASIEHFMEARSKQYGMPLEEFALKGSDREPAWQKLEQEFELIGSFIDKNSGGGPFFGGDSLLFADTMLLAQFLWMNRVLPAEEWSKVASWQGGRWQRLVNEATQRKLTDIV